jgi:hypothetical protein
MLIHPFAPSARATSSRNPAKSAQTVPLPIGSILPTASSSAESFKETFLLPDGFSTKLGPQIRLLLVPNFAVNTVGPGRLAQPTSRPSQPLFDLADFGLFIAPRPGATHQLIRHPPPRSREERDTIPEKRGSSYLTRVSLAGMGTLQGRPRRSSQS